MVNAIRTGPVRAWDRAMAPMDVDQGSIMIPFCFLCCVRDPGATSTDDLAGRYFTWKG